MERYLGGTGTGMIAAPVMIDGKRYICVVEVIRNKKDNRLYTHEVTLQEKLLDVRSKPSQSQSEIPATNQGALAKVLQKNVTAKENCSKVVDENGEPRVVYHQTNSTIFVNRETGESFYNLNWKEKDYWKNEVRKKSGRRMCRQLPLTSFSQCFLTKGKRLTGGI